MLGQVQSISVEYTFLLNNLFMMINTLRYTLYLLLILSIYSCGSDDGSSPMPNQPNVTPELSVQETSAIEVDGGVSAIFEVRANRDDFTEEVSFDYQTRGLTAEPGVDFNSISGRGTIAVGSNTLEINIEVLNDDIREIDEEFELVISNAQNATIQLASNIATIRDNDPSNIGDSDGYNTPTSYFGFDQSLVLDFDEATIDEDVFSFELGDGCDQSLCGWGNNELQKYSDSESNARIVDGRLVITATEDQPNDYRSARMITKDKVEFQFGRVDVRAKLPTGQGLWPAIWMLGANIDEVGWPASGEIDIMEMIGNRPNTVFGTAHWGNAGDPSTFQSGEYTNAEEFSQSFHVFSLVWERDEIVWYVDEEKYHTVSRSTVGNVQYRFNEEFFLILNVAVGGNFPGDPDETTIFPQSMEIDYLRVFQRN